MKRFQFSGFMYFLLLSWLPLLVSAQQKPTVAWDRTFGGSSHEFGGLVQVTPDGGFIVLGSSNSGSGVDKTQASKGNSDFWIVKTDKDGKKEWDKAFGGRSADNLNTITPTSDGGFILGGNSSSGVDGDVSQGNYGNHDYWIIKIDSGGNKVWDKTFIADEYDILHSIKQTADGGFLLGGSSHSKIGGSKSEPNIGQTSLPDFWIIKLNSSGLKQWDKTIGGTGKDEFAAMATTSDGGFILGGTSGSGIGADKTEISRGGKDYWIVKTDSNGKKKWDRTFGGTDDDVLTRIIQTTDGGFLLGGYSESDRNGDKSQASHGWEDYWVLKLDGAGNKIWDKTLGGSSFSQLFNIQQASDGGFLLSGNSYSGISLDKTEATKGGSDFWVVYLDQLGNKIWDKTIGGSGYEATGYITEVPDGYIVSGLSDSGTGADKTQPSRGIYDYWVVKLNLPCSRLTAKITPECIIGGINLKVEISATQNTRGKRSWTLNYFEDGVSKTLTDSVTTRTLAFNPKPGTVFNLVNITSGTCSTKLNQTFTMPAFPEYPVAENVSRCGPGPVMLMASGAPAGSKYVWYNVPSSGTPLQIDSTGKFTTPELKEPTLYYVAAQNEMGCEGPRTQVLVSLNNCPPFFIPNIITQNNDGKNETFRPQSLPSGTWNLQVFNRWGKLVYEKADYQNTWPEEKVNPGTYYYLLLNAEIGKQYKGWIEVNQ